MKEIFDCRMCGQCCEGRGGIVLARRDLARLAAFLGLTEGEAARRHAEKSSGKLRLKIGSDGRCVFFREGEGCAVHPAKPDVCRAWPFFRGNLEDPHSLTLARDYCPGIAKNVTHAQFAAAGLRWLEEENLIAADNDREAPNALKTGSLRAAGQRS